MSSESSGQFAGPADDSKPASRRRAGGKVNRPRPDVSKFDQLSSKSSRHDFDDDFEDDLDEDFDELEDLDDDDFEDLDDLDDDFDDDDDDDDS